MNRVIEALAPALVILVALVGVFTLAGYGVDWTFMIAGTLVTLVVSTVSTILNRAGA